MYPRRFESRRTGKAGYSPACGNEWVRGICEKPRIKCTECPHQRFLPVTDEAIRCHLSGRDDAGADFVMGVYPMLLDETCRFLAVDFDRESWREDALAYVETARRLDLGAAIECSRSGKGAHVWLFFAEPIPAIDARKLGAHLLTETMEARPEIGFASYDRFFPNQDTLPRGGLGNLIALPLQKRARDQGRTLFLDDALVPHPDQWAYLSSLTPITTRQVEDVVSAAEKRGRVVAVRLDLSEDGDEPWRALPSRRTVEPPIAGPLPESVELVIGDQIYVAKETLPPPLRNRLARLAAFQNPEFYRAQAMRLPTYDKPRIIGCAEDFPEHLALPRGCLEEAEALLHSLGIGVARHDERANGVPLAAAFCGTLTRDQQTAADAMLAHDTGVLAATTAFGKTVIAAWLIARRGVNTLVLVHRQQLLEQWVERLSTFLELPVRAIGRLGGGRKKLTGSLDVALIQSLVRKGVVKDCVADYGHLVVDECHHLSAHSFEMVARRAKARFVTGLSATVARKDGHHPIVFMQCGPVRHRVDAAGQAAARPFTHHVHVRPTGFRDAAPPAPESDSRREFARLYAELALCEPRNRMICGDVAQTVHEGRSPLVLTERTEHLEHLAETLSTVVEHVVVLRGGLARKVLRAALERLAQIPDGAPRVIVATGGFIGEGFDDARLDTLFLALPISWRGTVAQYAGRLHRRHEGKREVRIYDYADLEVTMFSRMFERRCRAYEAAGYTILLPASALPGWPVEVPLPVDPAWKRDYAGSVRRLIRDGVDLPLARLFTHAARPPGDEPGSHARSATEAFLHHRLETLPDTAGRFHLNVPLPIPFGTWNEMEVDFLCAPARLVIELDGPHHFADREAYRRDRCKDALLQERGYFVLRFLVEDIAQNLDAVLDSILRTLAHRQTASPAGRVV